MHWWDYFLVATASFLGLVAGAIIVESIFEVYSRWKATREGYASHYPVPRVICFGCASENKSKRGKFKPWKHVSPVCDECEEKCLVALGRKW